MGVAQGGGLSGGQPFIPVHFLQREVEPEGGRGAALQAQVRWREIQSWGACSAHSAWQSSHQLFHPPPSLPPFPSLSLLVRNPPKQEVSLERRQMLHREGLPQPHVSGETPRVTDTLS